jgi:hypothetical protein
MRRLARLPTELLLLAIQLVALALILGVPNLRAVADLLSSGFANATNVLALITTLLWAGSLALAGVVVVRAVRGVTTERRRPALLPIVAVLVGMGCLAAGIAHHQSTGFQPCCGSLERAQTTLETGR